jgi:acyl-CoA synthetase (AMP-forming)/AMP-acid ligase II
MIELTVARALQLSVERNRMRPAISCGGRELTFGELGALGNQIGNALLAAGLRCGDRVGVMLPNSLEYVTVIYALAVTGLVMIPLNYRFSGPEIAYPLLDSGARGLIYGDEYRAEVDRARSSVPRLLTFAIGNSAAADEGELLHLAQAQPTDAPKAAVRESDVFYLGYTSGTTGRPKGAAITHRNRALAFHYWALEYGIGSTDTALHVCPFHHTAPLTFTVTQLYMGGRVVIMPRFDPERVFRALAADGVTWSFMVPYMYNELIPLITAAHESIALSPLRFLISGGSALPTPTKAALMAGLPKVGLHEFYGATEAGIITNLRPEDQGRKIRCVGRPVLDSEVRVLTEDGRPAQTGEVGDIWIRSPTLFNGYFNAPEKTNEAIRDGWATIGDIGRLDSEGYLYIVDRKKDVIKSGGVNIFPAEIEEVILSHPSVLSAAVIGVPDERWGEAVHAVVVPRSGRAVTAQELIEFCRGTLSGYKLPKSVEFRTSLPLSPAGKILKRQLREELLTRAETK